MTIETECRKCGKSYNVPNSAAGRKIRCKRCQGIVAIPHDEEFAEDDYEDDAGYEDEYDDRPRRRAPDRRRGSGNSRRSRPRSSGGGKAALWIGVSVGGVAIVVGLIFLVINLSTSPHEKYIQKSISATNEVAAIIEGITTVEDAQAATQELAALVTEMRDATSEYRKGERPTLDESRNLQTKYREETRAAQTRLRQASQKLSPRLRSVMGSTVLRF